MVADFQLGEQFMNCNDCKAKLENGIKFCVSCGSPVLAETTHPQASIQTPQPDSEESDSELRETSSEASSVPQLEPGHISEISSPPKKTSNNTSSGALSLKITWLLATFFGFLGADRFYLGHVGTGVLKLIGFGWYGVWWLVDLVRINKGTQKDSSGELLNDPDSFAHKARAISAVLIPIVLILNAFFLVGVIAALLSPTAA